MEKNLETKIVGKKRDIKEDKKKKAVKAQIEKEEVSIKPEDQKEEKIEEKKPETKKESKEEVRPRDERQDVIRVAKLKKEEKPKKTEAVVRCYNIPISTKQSAAICKFIKGKKIGDAIRELEEVVFLRKAVPMKGEIPHRKGKIMSGRYPKKAAQNFIVLLKSLAANASDIGEPVISVAFANIGERPYGKFGRVRKKRTHIYIKAIEKKLNEKTRKNKNGRKKNS